MSHSKSPEQVSGLGKKGPSRASEHITQHQLARIPKDPAYGMKRYLDVSNARLHELKSIVDEESQESRDWQKRAQKLLEAFDTQFNTQLNGNEAKRRGITDVQTKPDPEKELHLSHLIDDIVNNIIHLHPDDQACETISTLLPKLLLLFAMRGHYQARIPAEMSLWLLVKNNRQ